MFRMNSLIGTTLALYAEADRFLSYPGRSITHSILQDKNKQSVTATEPNMDICFISQKLAMLKQMTDGAYWIYMMIV